MKRSNRSSRSRVLQTLLASVCVLALPARNEAFQSLSQQIFTALVTIGGSPSGQFSVPQLLPAESFFGKDTVIPVQYNTGGSGSPSLGGARAPVLVGVTIQMLYQLNTGVGVQPIVTVPLALQAQSSNPTLYLGDAVVPGQKLIDIKQGGTFNYWFQIQQPGQPVQIYDNTPGRNHGTAVATVPFVSQFNDTRVFPVSPDGSVVVVPDPYIPDGKTTFSFAPGALSNAGTLVVHLRDGSSLPAGPGGLSPVVAYDFALQGAALVRGVQITMTYPAHQDGTLGGLIGNPNDLAPYWLNGTGWLVMGPRNLDAALHTISFASPHFSTYALFLSGAVGAADLRPRQRILTPNGDGKNDTVDFSGIGASDGVHIFDAKGRRVKTLQFPNLQWTGTDDEGRIVESGIYIYQYTANGERISGVVLVAK
jgi:hypothetical protein